MKITFNEEKLKSLIKDFYNCTHIPISLYDNMFNCLYCADETPKYCCNVQNCLGEKFCTDCNQKHFEIVNQNKQVLTYTCDAGMCEIIAPVIHENIVIAYIMLGRFRDAEKKYSTIKQIRVFAEKYNMEIKEQVAVYRELPILKEDVVLSAINLLNVLIQFMWTEDLISTHKDHLPQKIDIYIKQNLSSESLTVEHICKTFHISQRTLYNIFHEELHDTFGNYVLKTRLHVAKKTLLNSKLRISEIATLCGFADYNYFTRAFTKRYGIPPTKLRKEYSAKIQYEDQDLKYQAPL